MRGFNLSKSLLGAFECRLGGFDISFSDAQQIRHARLFCGENGVRDPLLVSAFEC